MNFPQIAQQVIDKLGGKENIATAAHCATRLRLSLIHICILKVTFPHLNNKRL